ncbi:MAG: N-formylglutamate deformylase [Alphaproteobacteria bacterium]
MSRKTSKAIFDFCQGSTPLLVSVPHAGTAIPERIATKLTQQARVVPDTDWYVDRLYRFVEDIGGSMIVANYSRTVVDLNRPSTSESLYPGQNTTGLIPTALFTGDPVYQEGKEPTPDQMQERIRKYWEPYHNAIRTELDRLRKEHGRAMLWDAHSILSEVPWLFDGKLPDMNLGTNDGKSCDPALAAAVEAVAAKSDYSHVLNGRFKGGFITRNYGDPENNIHAIQLELCQSAYMNEDKPRTFRVDLAEQVRPVIRGMLETMIGWGG